ncbi:nucleolar complex protein 4 homolog [Copidosoma floridanum]|uniref:nucleolar complex protein 4 homolog n=1 Tax=Copidosoma floridanum TaxID=29053 RepID=UPI0006C99CF4|nr:nucleolar complex protein 4 homolog [Copidosoma floridanum]
MSTSKLLRQRAQEILGSRKHANNLLDILNMWQSHPNPCIMTIEVIFEELLRRGDLYQERTISLTISEPTPEIRYVNWLRNCYEEVWDKLLNSMEDSRPTVQTQALSTAIKLMAAEGKSPLEPVNNIEYYFPLSRLKSIIMKILSPDRDNVSLITRFQEISSYVDALHYTWKSLPSLTPKRQPHNVYIKNLLDFIHKLPLPQESSDSNQDLLCGPQGSGEFKCDYAAAKKALNKVWSCIMHWEVTQQLHKQLLIVLLERVMSQLDKPILMTDFLMDSLDANGPIGLLALQGVFILVTKHNLDYPNIFTKLYSMFEPEIFHTKYKARLFYLSDIFLSSTHLPEALVAAFAKRLSRLTLVAPPEDIRIILLFIGNLLMRHPGLKRLIDKPLGSSGSKNISPYEISAAPNDPYLMEERDPLQSNAMQSSLWEVKSLQCHMLPSVATAARFIREPLPSVEYDMATALEQTGSHIFDRELKNKIKDIMVTFERPNSMALPKGERLLQYWQLTTMH